MEVEVEVEVEVEYDEDSDGDIFDEFERWFELVAEDGELGSAVGDWLEWDGSPLADDAFDPSGSGTYDEVVEDGAPFELLWGDDVTSFHDGSSTSAASPSTRSVDTSASTRRTSTSS